MGIRESRMNYKYEAYRHPNQNSKNFANIKQTTNTQKWLKTALCEQFEQLDPTPLFPYTWSFHLSLDSLFSDRCVGSTEASSTQNAIYCFLYQVPASSFPLLLSSNNLLLIKHKYNFTLRRIISYVCTQCQCKPLFYTSKPVSYSTWR